MKERSGVMDPSDLGGHCLINIWEYLISTMKLCASIVKLRVAPAGWEQAAARELVREVPIRRLTPF